MKRFQKSLAVLILFSIAGMAKANEPVIVEPENSNTYLPSSLRVEAGTTGYGGALTWDLNPYVGLSLGYNGGDIGLSTHLKTHGIKYDAKQKDNQNIYLNAEIHPWGMSDNTFVKSVYVAAGAAYIDSEYALNSRHYSGTVTLNNNAYNINGNITGRMKYKNEIAPYIGIGARPMLSEHWGVFGEVGAYYTDNPSVNLMGNAMLNLGGNNVQFQQDVSEQASAIASEDKYKWLPSAKIGVVYRF